MKAVLPALRLLAALAPAANAEPILKHTASVSWICAGVGSDERRVLGELRPQVRLDVLFVTAKRGGYVSDAELSLYADGSAQPLLRVTADGPECLIDAPPGAYRVEAGFYLLATLERLPVLDADGAPVDDKTLIAGLTVR